jgi:ComF family protein
MDIFNPLFDYLFPGLCLCCGLPSGRSIDLCAGCEGEFKALTYQCQYCAEPLPAPAICPHCLSRPPPFSRIVAPFVYGSPLDKLILALKYGGELSAGRALGAVLAQQLSAAQRTPEARPDCLAPMPLHWRRRLERGFNQSREIARALSFATGIPIHNRLVRRIRNTPRQQGLNREQRQKNIRGAFVANPKCAGLHIAVIDDVVTTASTARAVAAALKAEGAKEVEIWCLARRALEK